MGTAGIGDLAEAAVMDRLVAAVPHWEKAPGALNSRLGSARMTRFLSDLSAAVAAARMET